VPLPDDHGSRAIDRRRLLLAGLAGVMFAVVVIAIASHGDPDKMIFGDGRLYRAVAQDLRARDPAIQAFIRTRGTSLRYGRIGFPVVLWAASGGSAHAMRWVQPALLVLAAGAVAAAASELIPGSVVFALAPFAAVGLTVSLTGGFAEPLAIAASLWAVVAAERKHPWVAAAALAIGILTRENAVAVLVGLVAWALLRGRKRDAWVLASAMVPVVAWYIFVDIRFGHLPFLDPWLRSISNSVGFPIVALWEPLTKHGFAAAALIVVHLALAIYAFVRWRTSDVAAVAAACGLTILTLGVDVWRFIGDATRVTSLLEVFVVIEILRRITARRSVPVEGAPSIRSPA